MNHFRNTGKGQDISLELFLTLVNEDTWHKTVEGFFFLDYSTINWKSCTRMKLVTLFLHTWTCRTDSQSNPSWLPSAVVIIVNCQLTISLSETKHPHTAISEYQRAPNYSHIYLKSFDHWKWNAVTWNDRYNCKRKSIKSLGLESKKNIYNGNKKENMSFIRV